VIPCFYGIKFSNLVNYPNELMYWKDPPVISKKHRPTPIKLLAAAPDVKYVRIFTFLPKDRPPVKDIVPLTFVPPELVNVMVFRFIHVLPPLNE
jgi:hypothetical protein